MRTLSGVRLDVWSNVAYHSKQSLTTLLAKILLLIYNINMEYKVDNNIITIIDASQFNPQHILECGQIFRYQKLNANDYVVFSKDKKAVIQKTKTGYQIISNYPDYFVNFFDLDADYNTIKQQLNSMANIMPQATNYGYGIRILNQQPLETIISFIISANNNIKRIKLIIERLCKFCGTNMGNFYAFPTLQQLQKLTQQDFANLGAGFRAKYLFNTIKMLCAVDLQKLRFEPLDYLLNFLQSLSGVGPKVAECIALFAYHNMYCFPVDTWVQKVYNQYFSNSQLTNRAQIRKNLVDRFKNLSGYAQQYLFYYKREMDTAK